MSPSKQEIIEERKANLPLPEDPPTTSDWNSADARNVDVGSGGVSSDVSVGDGSSGLRGPATGESSVRTDGDAYKTHVAPDTNIGRQGKDGLESLPKDAVIREAKNKV